MWLQHYVERHGFPNLINRFEDYGEAQGWGRRIGDFGPSDVKQLLAWLGQLLRARRKTPGSRQEREERRKSRKAPRMDRNAT
jgi:hypothetical protein